MICGLNAGRLAQLHFCNYIWVVTERVEWDEEKNRSNKSKHAVSFELASEVFDDPLHRSLSDRVVDGEERWVAMGLVGGMVLLIVAFTYRETGDGEVIRIISARKATRHKRRAYDNG